MQVLKVHQFLALVNETLRLTISSDELAIEGEVSDFRVSQGKWVSFDLKDEEENAVLKCFATIWQINVPVEDGMKVKVKGYVKIYERFGQLKLNVQSLELVGEGALARAYELLKKKLEKEGLFDMSRKRVLPRFPEKIGLITSREAAAYGDFLRILNNRWAGIIVQHANVHVQGKNAVPEIRQAFEAFNAMSESKRPDVLVLTRGGGGLEDLHAFNDEYVARAVFQSKIPVICAVGHERDESLADFVADMRASTPSNAAEIVVPDKREILYEIVAMAHRMEDQFTHKIESGKSKIQRVFLGTEAWLVGLKSRLESHERLLKNLDPTRILSRGYSIVKSGGKVIKNAASLKSGDKIHVRFAKGDLEAKVL